MTQQQLNQINRLVEYEVKEHPLYQVFQGQGFWGNSVEVRYGVAEVLRWSDEKTESREYLHLNIVVLYKGSIAVQMGCDFNLDEEDQALVVVTRRRLDDALNLILSSGLSKLTTP